MHPLFRMDKVGRDYREETLGGTADPKAPPKDLQGSLGSFQTKTVDGVLEI